MLQVDRVLARMNEFLRLMHEGLIVRAVDERSIDTAKEMARGRRRVEPIREPLTTAFPVRTDQISGDDRPLAVTASASSGLRERFSRLSATPLPEIAVDWEPDSEPGTLHGTARLGERIQPFALLLRTVGARPAVRCISPVGRVRPKEDQDQLVATTAACTARLGAIATQEEITYDLTVEDEVLLADDERHDAARIGLLVQRVVHEADLLEQVELPGMDQALAGFRTDLGEEQRRGR